MKAWIACALAAVPALKAKRLGTSVHLALSFDEEVGCLGAPTMLESFGREVPKPRVAIVGEPSLMAPINAHKGMLALETTITGRAAHSSLLHLGVSAVSAAAEMAVELHRIAREWMDLDGPSGMKPSGPTASVGVLQGGVARNIVAREALLQWEIRFRAKDDLQHLLQFAMDRIKLRLQRRFGADYEALQIATRELATIPAFDAGHGGLAELLVQRLGAAGVASAVPYGAEAGQYANAGISTVICGPGSIEQAHQPDEYISISQVRSCDEFMARLSECASEVHLSSNADALA